MMTIRAKAAGPLRIAKRVRAGRPTLRPLGSLGCRRFLTQNRGALSRNLLGASAGLALLATGPAGAVAAEGGNWFTNMLTYGGPTVPPSQPSDREAAYCPSVDIAEGGAALQTFGGRAGGASSVRSQITLGRLARECARLQDGSLAVKVGVEGQVLLGPAGTPGRFDAPVHIAIKSGGKVVTARVKRVPVAIGAGEAQGLFAVVEDNLIVPPASAENYEIEVRLGGGSPREPGPRKRKAPVAAAASPGTTGAQ